MFPESEKDLIVYTMLISLKWKANPLSQDPRTGKLKMRDLKGDEYEIVSEKIEFLEDGFKGLKNIKKLMKIWKGFFDILRKIKMDQLDTK
jgi:hypothetical protein